MKVDIPDANEQNIIQKNSHLMKKNVFMIIKTGQGTLRNAVVSWLSDHWGERPLRGGSTISNFYKYLLSSRRPWWKLTKRYYYLSHA